MEDHRERLKKIKEKAFLLREKFEEYLTALAKQAEISLDISTALQELINERNWSINAYIDKYSISQDVRNGLMIVLRCSDFSGNKISWPLTEHEGYYRTPSIFNVAGEKTEKILDFCEEFLWYVNSQLDNAYETAFSSLSPQVQTICRKFLDELRKKNRAIRSLHGSLNNSTERAQNIERDLWSKTGELDNKIQSLEKQLEHEKRAHKKYFGIAVDRITRFRDLQRTIERETRNILNTKSFLGTKSKGLQGIRERLMIAISKEELGEDSIYHDHEPPEDLMPKRRKGSMTGFPGYN